MPHRYVHENKYKHQRRQKPSPESGNLIIFKCNLSCITGSAIPCTLNSCNNIACSCTSAYRHGICEQTYRTFSHPIHFGYSLFYSCGAGCTRHTCNLVFIHSYHLISFLMVSISSSITSSLPSRISLATHERI